MGSFPSMLTQHTSVMPLNVSHFYQDVGMEGGKNFYCAGGATPLLSAMLSIRYVLADNAMEEGPLRTLVAQRGDTYLYENAYVLPLGFMMDEDVAEKWDYAGGGDIGTQNQLANLLGSDRLLLTAVESESKAGESSFVAQDSAYYYATYSKTGVDNLQEQVSSGRTRGFTRVSQTSFSMRLRSRSSIVAPVSTLVPYNLAGITFVLFRTRQSPGFKYSTISVNTLCSTRPDFRCSTKSLDELLSSSGSCAINSFGKS